MKSVVALLTLAAGIAAVSLAGFAADPATAPAAAPAGTPAALAFSVKDIDGKDVNLWSYKGKVLLILNVASKCGNTPQYEGLEKMYTKYKDKGLVVMGFPANDFGGQEPGSNEQIKEFCSATYDVQFPMFAKVQVLKKDKDMAPLFTYLTNQESKPLSKGDIKWNFEKFLISREGKLVGRFDNKMKPEDPVIVKAVEAELDAK
ncbi:MAG TPA: glutathione peroxidase [Phycisphaerae bacterium]|nr:glutathione peroxidase [Phycisphaerae bacterium]